MPETFDIEHAAFFAARRITTDSALASGLSSTPNGIRVKYPVTPAGEASKRVRAIQDGLALGGAAPFLYVPPSFASARTNSNILIISDCEFEAISACDHGLATVAGPVNDDLITLAKEFSAVVVICDSEGKSNKEVKKAYTTKLTAFRQALPNVHASLYVMPKASDIGLTARNIQLSTWITKEGEVTTEMRECIFRHAMLGIRRMTSATEQGYTALGLHEGKFVVYSKQLGLIKQMAPAEVGRKSELMALMGYDYILAHYPSETGANWDQACGDLMKECSKKKIFNVERVRGGGVWEEGGKLVINGLECYRVDGSTFDRTSGQNVYNMTRNLGINVDAPIGTIAHSKEVLGALSSWKWKRPTDAYVSLGWMMLAYVAGALKMRPHAFLHGELGSGKSTFMQLMSLFLGGAGLYLGKASEAGLRQTVKEDAVGILIDEQESNSTKIGQILEYLRLSSTGAKQNMGTDNHNSTKFLLRSIGLLAGIVPPKFETAADSSRFLMMAIEQIDSEKVSHDLVIEAEEMNEDGRTSELGRLMFMRMVTSWDRFVATEDLFRDVLPEGSKRMQSVIAPVLAASWVALHDGDIDIDGARMWSAKIDLTEDVDRINSASELDNFVDYFYACMPANQESGHKFTVGELLDISYSERGRGPASSILGQCGIKVKDDHILIVPRNKMLLELFAQSTKYSSGDLLSLFKRIPGAAQKMTDTEKLRFGGGNAQTFLRVPYQRPELGSIIDTIKPRKNQDSMA